MTIKEKRKLIERAEIERKIKQWENEAQGRISLGRKKGGDGMKKIITRIFLWIHKKHKWHKDWLGCKICELRFKHNPDKPDSKMYRKRGEVTWV
jgi:hypothetical protein